MRLTPPLTPSFPFAEYYEWVKLEDTPENRTTIEAYWCEQETLFGKTIYDCRQMK